MEELKNGYEWDVKKIKRLNKDEAEIFKSLYLKGVPLAEISRILEISVSAVKQRIRRQKLSKCPAKLDQKTIDRMFELWQDRLSIRQIAIRLDLTKDIVWYQLKKMALVG